ncbi:uncharacterized protein BO66DRAFT_116147 [Aspergillus aculeatinus CBS 121060]|uniref:Uncharacterized protein n=1 Tax=Aspergillus aculeatinus CBS 121060 TaxID=1448322 RepID=A0ACD1H6X8_9EURO|nr:hypothetical protein BO66DRAFT_116147 [Aspergillus aculeatinus CBS 121060]RAH69154.1 hypothetical protein BO66DRAFT_116147 [Aspergillus aculeatinus CBS 121060]
MSNSGTPPSFDRVRASPLAEKKSKFCLAPGDPRWRMPEAPDTSDPWVKNTRTRTFHSLLPPPFASVCRLDGSNNEREVAKTNREKERNPSTMRHKHLFKSREQLIRRLMISLHLSGEVQSLTFEREAMRGRPGGSVTAVGPDFCYSIDIMAIGLLDNRARRRGTMPAYHVGYLNNPLSEGLTRSFSRPLPALSEEGIPCLPPFPPYRPISPSSPYLCPLFRGSLTVCLDLLSALSL